MITKSNKSKPKDRNTNIRMKSLKCENCGAPITPDAVGCEYCGVSFIVEETESIDICAGVKDGIMTPNEIRRMIGLNNGIATPNEAERYLKEGIMPKDEIVRFLNLDEPEDPHTCPIRRLDDIDNPTLKDWLDALYFVFTGKEKV